MPSAWPDRGRGRARAPQSVACARGGSFKNVILALDPAVVIAPAPRRAAAVFPLEARIIMGPRFQRVHDAVERGQPVAAAQAHDIRRGIRLRSRKNQLVVDLHIVTGIGANMSAITDSIRNKVRYAIEQATGLEPAAINVYIDGIRA